MIKKGLIPALVFVASTVAVPAAAQFMAADLIYVPAVTRTNGDGESRWRSDVFITNVENDAEIDVALIYLPTGGVSNAGAFEDRELWVGGREEDGFGFINAELASIPPRGTVVVRDPVGQYWGTLDGVANSGTMVVFAYEADTLEDDGTRVLRNAIVNSRAYTPSNFFVEDPDNEGEYVQVNGTYGMTLPGVAWYNLADPSAVSEEENFSFLLLTGAKDDPQFRYNVGIINASDPLTSITVSIQPIQGNGEPYLDDNDEAVVRVVNLPPNARIQYDDIFNSQLGLGNTPDDTILRIGFVGWSSGAGNPIVGLTVYGTMVDNRTQDPTAILPLFGYPYDVDCQWSSPDEKSSTAGTYPRVSRRPVDIPPR